MGKQINFYMSKVTQGDFIEFLKQNNFLFLTRNSAVIDDISFDDISTVYLYKQDYENIIRHQSDVIDLDIIKSSIIEFSKTRILKEEKKILRGRLWISTQYDDDEDNMIIRKEELIIKDYQRLVRWIKKNVPYQNIQKGKYYVKEYASDELVALQDEGFALTL